MQKNRQRLLLLMLLFLFTPFVMAGKGMGGGGKWGKTDTTPNAFYFIDQTNVALSTTLTTNTINVSGINAASPISINNGQYAVNGGSFSTSSSTVNNGDTVVVKQVSSAQYSSTTNTVLTIGGVSDTFSSTTLAAPVVDDSTPNAFSFSDQSGIALSTQVVSNTITVSGINVPSALSISGGEYSVNGGAYSSANTSVNNNDSVKVRVMSAATYSTAVHVTLTIGGVSATFTVTTQAEPVSDTTPDAFSFIDQSDVAVSTWIASNVITVSGINAPTALTISGGEYSVNGGGYATANTTVNANDSVRVRVLSAATEATASNAAITIGGISDAFTVMTAAQSDNFQLAPQASGNPSFTSEHFAGSSNCTMCHNNLSDSQGNDVSIETDWSATMMANAARDPLWKAKVRTELTRSPQLADVINDKCTRCHAPMANYEAKKNNEPMAVLDNGFLNPSHSRHDEAMNGVSCTLCHQIQDSPDLGTLPRFTGKYGIGENKEIFGPYDNLFPNPMIMNTGYTPLYSPHIKESEVCATCHNLKTPYTDDFGNVLSQTPEEEFPEQMPYSEWLHSDYVGTNSCQSCHMSRANGVPISNRPMWLEGRDNFAVHEFAGANKLMLGILKSNKEQLGVTASNFDDILAATDTILNSAASLTVSNQALAQNELSFTLNVNSQTGHKLPSAYPSRRVIVHVTVKDAQNNIVFESGKINANGSVEGLDSDSSPNSYEPHYDLITSADQVQAYESIMGDNNGNVTYTLLRGMVYLKDNRLLPNGFNKNTAPDDVKVAGAALADSNFVGGSDQITYRIAGLGDGSYTVQAELLYQTLAYGFAQDLFTDTSAEVHDFKKMYNAVNDKFSTIASKTFTVQ